MGITTGAAMWSSLDVKTTICTGAVGTEVAGTMAINTAARGTMARVTVGTIPRWTWEQVKRAREPQGTASGDDSLWAGLPCVDV